MTELQKALKAEYLRRNFWEFFQEAWKVLEPDTELITGWHMEYIARIAQQIVEDVIAQKVKTFDYLVNVPPGSTKSSMLTIALQPWAWLHKPSLRFITTSWDSQLSINHAVKSRDLIKSTWYQEKWSGLFYLKTDKNKKSEFENNHTGIRIATSVGASITGRHADIQVGDDLNTPEKAASKDELTKVNNYWDKTLSSRVTNMYARRLVVQQRIHENDLTGYLLENKKGKYAHICIPAQLTKKAIVSPDSLRKYYKNGLMDTIRLNATVLENKKIELGSAQYSGQMLQTPTPEEGNKFNRDWFPVVDRKLVPKFLRRNLWIDGAYTKKTTEDPTGFMATAMDERKRILYILNFTSKFMEMPELIKYLPNYHGEYCDRRSRVYIEPKASGKSLKQMLKSDTDMNAVEINSYIVQEGKEARADAASPTCEAGRVYVVKGSWNEDFFHQLETFPNALHDEAVDNLCYAVHHHFIKKKRKRLKRRN